MKNIIKRNLKTNITHRLHNRPPNFIISPFVQALDACLSIDVWATPSIIPGLHTPIKTGEYSISMNGFGSHLDNTGLLGDVAKRAAINRFADSAVLTTSGTTSSNHKVMLMLHTEFKGRPILVSRNCHHSIILSAQMYGVKLCFINNPPWIDEYDAMLPPTANDVKKALERHPDACAVLISSPTYEGIVAEIEEISYIIQKYSNAIFWVDQAWGSHFGSSSNVPKSAMQLGADIVCESVHKNGGALQGSALLLWKRGKYVTDRAMFEAHMKEETTSPNFNIFASIDAALLRIKKEPELVDDLCDLINDVKDRLSDENDLTFLNSNSYILSHNYNNNDNNNNNNNKPLLIDPTRLCIGFKGRSGQDIRSYLEKNNIEIEKNGRKNILLIATFQLPPQAADHVTTAISNALKDIKYNEKYDVMLSSPYENTSIDPYIPSLMLNNNNNNDNTNNNNYTTEYRQIANCIGEICDEMVECYPPGIPLLLPGYIITSNSINYLIKMKELNSIIISSDKSFQTIRIRKY